MELRENPLGKSLCTPGVPARVLSHGFMFSFLKLEKTLMITVATEGKVDCVVIASDPRV